MVWAKFEADDRAALNTHHLKTRELFRFTNYIVHLSFQWAT
jgi:hypothetical protein